MVFDGCLGQPQILRPRRWVVIWFLQGPTVNSQMGSSTIQDTQYNIKQAGLQGYENTRMQNEKAEDTGYRIEEIPSSLVAPLKRGRRITQSQTLMCLCRFCKKLKVRGRVLTLYLKGFGRDETQCYNSTSNFAFSSDKCKIWGRVSTSCFFLKTLTNTMFELYPEVCNFHKTETNTSKSGIG